MNLSGVTQEDFPRPGLILQIGVPPNRIDILTSIAGVDFQEAWPSKVVTSYAAESIYVIGREPLIRNKRTVLGDSSFTRTSTSLPL